MYELKKIGKVFTSKFVGTGPSSYQKKYLPGRSLTKVEKHWSSTTVKCIQKYSEEVMLTSNEKNKVIVV